MMFLGGVDEAGRGPVLGPMVMAIVIATKEQEEKFIGLGVKDSKELKVSKRLELFDKIKDISEESAVAIIEPDDLNKLMPRHSLNEIEAMYIADLLNSLKSRPDLLFVDSPDSIESNFSKRIIKYCEKKIDIRSEHYADTNYPVVSAASILAKVTRDREIDRLKEEFGELGSGYSHDEVTRKFLSKWVEEKGSLPSCARAHWETSKRELNKKFQKKLGEY